MLYNEDIDNITIVKIIVIEYSGFTRHGSKHFTSTCKNSPKTQRGSYLCSSSMVAVINRHKPCGLKQPRFIILQFRGSEIRHREHWAKF